MLISLTGTPGTGKKSVGRVLESRGFAVIDVEQTARAAGAIVGRDQARGSDEVDLAQLARSLRVPAKVAFLGGHYGHLLDVDIAIVLRCKPSVLRLRLEARGWPPAKVRENVEAEAIGVVLQEALDRVPFVYEIDTTTTHPDQAAEMILEILQGRTVGHEPGSVDWTEEVLSWY